MYYIVYKPNILLFSCNQQLFIVEFVFNYGVCFVKPNWKWLVSVTAWEWLEIDNLNIYRFI